MCKKSSKPAPKPTGGGKSGGNNAAPQRGAERARDVAQGAQPAAAVASDATEAQGQGAMNRRRGRGKRNFRLAGQQKMALRPDRANVGGSGRSGLNIPRSS